MLKKRIENNNSVDYNIITQSAKSAKDLNDNDWAGIHISCLAELMKLSKIESKSKNSKSKTKKLENFIENIQPEYDYIQSTFMKLEKENNNEAAAYKKEYKNLYVSLLIMNNSKFEYHQSICEHISGSNFEKNADELASILFDAITFEKITESKQLAFKKILQHLFDKKSKILVSILKNINEKCKNVSNRSQKLKYSFAFRFFSNETYRFDNDKKKMEFLKNLFDLFLNQNRANSINNMILQLSEMTEYRAHLCENEMSLVEHVLDRATPKYKAYSTFIKKMNWELFDEENFSEIFGKLCNEFSERVLRKCEGFGERIVQAEEIWKDLKDQNKQPNDENNSIKEQ